MITGNRFVPHASCFLENAIYLIFVIQVTLTGVCKAIPISRAFESNSGQRKPVGNTVFPIIPGEILFQKAVKGLSPFWKPVMFCAWTKPVARSSKQNRSARMYLHISFIQIVLVIWLGCLAAIGIGQLRQLIIQLHTKPRVNTGCLHHRTAHGCQPPEAGGGIK